MKSGRNHNGFTIVEVLIVLAVTSAILISALTLISGSQSKTQFNQAINDINQQIGSTANNVANGYYSNTIQNKKCTASAAGDEVPKFNTGAGALGANAGCIYLGRVIQFTKGEEFYFHNVVGRQRSGAPAVEVTTMDDANPQIIEPGALTHNIAPNEYPKTTVTKQLKSGLTPSYIRYRNSNTDPWKYTSGVAFMSTLATIGASITDLSSGALAVDVAPTTFDSPIEVASPGSVNEMPQYIDAFDNVLTGFGSNYDANKNPNSGVIICFDSGTTDQHAEITVGGQNQRTTTRLQISDGKCVR